MFVKNATANSIFQCKMQFEVALSPVYYPYLYAALSGLRNERHWYLGLAA